MIHEIFDYEIEEDMGVDLWGWIEPENFYNVHYKKRSKKVRKVKKTCNIKYQCNKNFCKELNFARDFKYFY